MSIFSSKQTTYLTFYIVLTDAALVDQYTQLYPEGVNRAPLGAAEEFAAPWEGYDEPLADPPFSYTTWRRDDTSDAPFPLDVATFQRHTGGFFGIGGTTIRYYWMGKFVYQNPADPTSGGGSPVTATSKRRWIEGFECPNRSISGNSTQCTLFTTDASRHTGGRGLAFRGNTGTLTQRLAPNQYDATFVAPIMTSWERFYVRLRKAPTTGTVLFWRTHGYNGSDGVGHALGITTSGQIAVFTSDAANTYTNLGTLSDTTLEAWDGHASSDVWAKIDVLIDLTLVTFKVFVNGSQKWNASGLAGGATGHTGSSMGAPVNQAANDLELDIDDWFNSNLPTTLDGLDWDNGSKIVHVHPRQFSANHGTWAGDVRTLLQQAENLTSPAELTSSTSGDICAVDTDGDDMLDSDPKSIGVASLLVTVVGRKAAAPDVNPSIGYKLGGAAAVVTQRTMQATYNNIGIGAMYSAQAGAAAPLPAVTPLELRVVKGADANQTRLVALSAQVELLGKFSQADFTTGERTALGDSIPQNESMGPHNYSYPRSPWAVRGLAPPISPFLVASGTYTGNGTGQDLTFAVPIHFLFIRPLTGGAGGAIWFQHALASHHTFQRGTDPSHLVLFEQDPAFAPGTGEDAQQHRYKVRICGANSQVNQAAVTYQYVAIGDPGMRFLLGGSLHHKTGMGDVVNNLLMTDYTPEFLFLQNEVSGSNTTRGLWCSGPSQSAADTIAAFDNTAASAATLSKGAGTITSKNALYTIGTSWNYLGVRRDDGSGDTGLPGVVAVGSYTGDGAGSRTIAFPTSGKRPLFAMVFTEAAAQGWSRDPSNTGTNSTQQNGTDGATGITAGAVDSMTVGSSLNQSSVVYSYFVVFSCESAAGNNGWGQNTTCYPVEAVHPGGGTGGWPPVPTEPVPEEPTEPEDPGSAFPGGPPTTPVDFSVECAPWATYMVNLALSRIGISKQLADVVTDSSQEAYKARLVYAQDVEDVLRDFPWPFATRYSSLTLVAGTATVPVNKDWQYAYRAPSNMVAARRIVSQEYEQRGFDPDPPQFRIGTDSTGYLIYANAVSSSDVPVQLEYTFRMTCPASQGDAKFRDALVWKLARSLALSIARDPKKGDYCEAMYQGKIVEAKVVAANESQPSLDQGDAPWIRER